MRRAAGVLTVAILAIPACKGSQDDEVSRVACGEFELVVVETLSRKPPAGWEVDFHLWREAGDERKLVDERRRDPAYPPPTPDEGYRELQPSGGTKYTWHVHVNPAEFDRAEYDAIVACLEANLETLQSDLERSRPPYDQFPKQRQPKIVSVRYLDYDGLRRTWRAGAILQELVLEPTGDFFLTFSGRRTFVGFLQRDGRNALLLENPENPNLDEQRIDDIGRYVAQFENPEGRTVFHTYEVEVVSKDELEQRRKS